MMYAAPPARLADYFPVDGLVSSCKSVNLGAKQGRLKKIGEAEGLGIQPRVKSLRSSYTGLYPPIILHGVVSKALRKR